MTGIPRELRESHDAASARAAFARYVADRRGHGVPGFRIDRFPPYLRFTADDGASDGCVAYTALSPGHEGRQIDEAVAYFAQTGRAFEWKVYAFDVPADLQARLAERGFVAGDAETLMLLPLATNALADPASGRHPWQIERVSAATGIDGVAAVSRAVWDEPGDDLASQLHATLKTAPRTLSVYLALEEGVPIATGWTEYPVGSSFPELHGGAVIPSARGRGVYRSLMAARLDEVRKRGYADVTVDALPASRPILERLGFRSICRTVPMRWSPD